MVTFRFASVQSKNCLREVLSSVVKQKPITLTHEADPSKGGGPLETITLELDNAELLGGVFGEDRDVIIWWVPHPSN